MLFANSTAILTDAFPADRRGFALGVNQVAAIAGSFLGLIIGGLLSEWTGAPCSGSASRSASVGTVWAYRTLHDKPATARTAQASTGGATSPSRVGLIALLVGITYGIQPYGGAHHGLDATRGCSPA